MYVCFSATTSKASPVLFPHTHTEHFQRRVLGWWLRKGRGDSWHETQRLGTSSQCSSLGTHGIIENWLFHLHPLLSFLLPLSLCCPQVAILIRVVHRDAMCVCKSLLRLPVNKAVLCTLHLTLSLQNSPWWTDVQVSESV